MTRTIRINGIDVPVIADEMSGAELKQAAGVEPDRVLVKQDPERNTIVGDGQRVRLADGDVFAHHARHSKAHPDGDPDRGAGMEAGGGAGRGSEEGLAFADRDRR